MKKQELAFTGSYKKGDGWIVVGHKKRFWYGLWTFGGLRHLRQWSSHTRKVRLAAEARMRARRGY